MSQYNFKTDRLNLTPLNVSDVHYFHQLNIHPIVRKYLWDDQQIDRSTAKSILKKNRVLFDTEALGLWKISLKANQQILGYTGLWYFYDESQPQLLYVLHPDYIGHGYAQEAARSIIAYAFNKLDFQYVHAAIDEPHTTSQKTAKSLGLTFTERKIIDDKPILFFRRDR